MTQISHRGFYKEILLWVKKNGLLVIVPLLIFLGFHYVLDFNGLYGQDSHEYFRFAKELQTNFYLGKSSQEFHWPKAYSALGTIVASTGLSVLLSLRLVSICSFIGVLLVTKRIISLIYDKDATWFLLLGGVTQIYFMRAGMLVMSDMTTAFFVICICYFLVQQQLRNRSIYFVGVLLFSFFAFFTRYASAPLLLAFVCYGLLLLGKKHRWYLSVIYAIVIGVASFFLMKANSNWGNISVAILEQWSWKNVFSRSLASSDGVSNHWVPNIMYVFGNFFHVGYLSFGVLLLPFYKMLRPMNWKVIGGLMLYFVLLIGLSTQNYRFLVLSHALVLILLFPVYDRFTGWLKGKGSYVLFILGTILVNGAFGVYSFRKTLIVHQNEKEIVHELKKHIKNETIYSFYIDQSFSSYEITNEVRNFYMDDYLEFEKGALVVFNENKFSKQWKDHRVMNNWNRLKTNYELDTIATLSENWQIYRIK